MALTLVKEANLDHANTRLGGYEEKRREGQTKGRPCQTCWIKKDMILKKVKKINSEAKMMNDKEQRDVI